MSVACQCPIVGKVMNNSDLLVVLEENRKFPTQFSCRYWTFLEFLGGAKTTHSPSRHHYMKNTSWAGFVLVQKVKAACDGDVIADGLAARPVSFDRNAQKVFGCQSEGGTPSPSLEKPVIYN
ncbi:hypothetical protein CEXT_685011 [Caerostris extrusa]|uniref:Uncharacterized protein n=1 Tax=Caerostris extrusa TaxID=172846 RepID=A0AAV4V146_CAEEX|nr:hypothetical protein CEXT_685011 [Caerostris extrusa]